MNRKYSKKECNAIDRKLMYPTETVICPRCGEQLIFKDGKYGCEVKCPSKDCLHGVVRGI